jgi:hypothetical protein
MFLITIFHFWKSINFHQILAESHRNTRNEDFPRDRVKSWVCPFADSPQSSLAQTKKKRSLCVRTHKQRSARLVPVCRDRAQHRAELELEVASQPAQPPPISLPPCPPAPCAHTCGSPDSRRRGYERPARRRVEGEVEKSGDEESTGPTPWTNRRSWRRRSGW